MGLQDWGMVSPDRIFGAQIRRVLIFSWLPYEAVFIKYPGDESEVK